MNKRIFILCLLFITGQANKHKHRKKKFLEAVENSVELRKQNPSMPCKTRINNYLKHLPCHFHDQHFCQHTRLEYITKEHGCKQSIKAEDLHALALEAEQIYCEGSPLSLDTCTCTSGHIDPTYVAPKAGQECENQINKHSWGWWTWTGQAGWKRC